MRFDTEKFNAIKGSTVDADKNGMIMRTIPAEDQEGVKFTKLLGLQNGKTDKWIWIHKDFQVASKTRKEKI